MWNTSSTKLLIIFACMRVLRLCHHCYRCVLVDGSLHILPQLNDQYARMAQNLNNPNSSLTFQASVQRHLHCKQVELSLPVPVKKFESGICRSFESSVAILNACMIQVGIWHKAWTLCLLLKNVYFSRCIQNFQCCFQTSQMGEWGEHLLNHCHCEERFSNADPVLCFVTPMLNRCFNNEKVVNVLFAKDTR